MRVIILFFIMLSSALITFAQNDIENVTPIIKFNHSKYALQYSNKNEQTGGMLNEYYKKSESYYNWSELLVVHTFPNASFPIEQANVLKEYVSLNYKSHFFGTIEERESIISDFMLVNDKKLPIILEFNIFKFEKNSSNEVVALQYSRRYILNNPLEIYKVKKSLENTRLKYIRKISSTPIPNIITTLVDNGIFLQSDEPEVKPVLKDVDLVETLSEVQLDDNIDDIKSKGIDNKEMDTSVNKVEEIVENQERLTTSKEEIINGENINNLEVQP